jgi:hypothetical protein
MIKSIEDLRSGGELPIGPVSAWPQERNEGKHELKTVKTIEQRHDTHIKASPMQMIGGLVQSAGQALTYGRVSDEIRQERYNTCKECPHFIEDSKRCSECGCFMEAKTWIAGNPAELCPKKKWKR